MPPVKPTRQASRPATEAEFQALLKGVQERARMARIEAEAARRAAPIIEAARQRETERKALETVTRELPSMSNRELADLLITGLPADYWLRGGVAEAMTAERIPKGGSTPDGPVRTGHPEPKDLARKHMAEDDLMKRLRSRKMQSPFWLAVASD